MTQNLSITPLSLALLASAVIFSVCLGILTSTRKQTRHPWRLAVTLGGVVLPIILFISAIQNIGVNVPYWDDYGVFLPYLSLPFPDRLLHLFDFQNEHRIMVVRLVSEVIFVLNGSFSFKICMYVGNAMLLLYLLLLWSKFKRTSPAICLFFIPCLWLFTDLLNHENMFWALTSIQSNSVLLFGLLTFVFLDHSTKFLFYILALICAIFCTFSSGSGVFIWPCMAAMIVRQSFDKKSPRSVGVLSVKSLLFIGVATVVLVFYFHGFNQHTDSSQIQTLLRHPMKPLTFFMVFCGGAAPLQQLALALGFVLCVLFILVASRLPRVKNYVVLFFLLFLLSAAASAAVFRSEGGIEMALSYRYRVVSVSIFTCTLLLFLENWTLPRPVATTFCALTTTGAVLLNLTVAIFSWNLQVERGSKLVNNILMWPSTNEGLRSPNTTEASKILENSVKSGVYTPSALIKNVQPKPTKLIPWS